MEYGEAKIRKVAAQREAAARSVAAAENSRAQARWPAPSGTTGTAVRPEGDRNKAGSADSPVGVPRKAPLGM